MKWNSQWRTTSTPPAIVMKSCRGGGGGQFQNLTRCFLGRYIISIGYCNVTLQRRDNECDGVSNHRCLECLLNRLFKLRSTKTSQFQNLTRCFLGRCIISIGYCNVTLQRRDNECDGVSNHRCLECLLNRLFKLRSKKTSQFRVTDLCEGNPPVTRWIPLTKGQ